MHRASCGLAVVLLGAFSAGAGEQSAKWTDISSPVVKQLKDDQKKIDWPGETAGVAVDPASGDVFMIVPGQGIWKSADQGKSFARADEGTIGGRCETSYSLQMGKGTFKLETGK